MNRADKLMKEAKGLFEADTDLFASDDDTLDPNSAAPDANADDDAPLDLGAAPEDTGLAPEDDFDLGGTSTPSVRVEKDGPITVNKGDVQLTIGDDGGIDITLDGEGGDLLDDTSLDSSDADSAGDLDGEPAADDDEYKIDWEKEGEDQTEEEPKESFSKARLVLSLEESVITECNKGDHGCVTCGGYDCCKDKTKQHFADEEESDFLKAGYM